MKKTKPVKKQSISTGSAYLFANLAKKISILTIDFFIYLNIISKKIIYSLLG
jgi:hypothetical protein